MLRNVLGLDAVEAKAGVCLPCFDTVTLEHDVDRGILWLRLRPRERPSFTIEHLEDLISVHLWLPKGHAECKSAGLPPFRYVVAASDIPGIYQLGGDLPLFHRLIQEGNRDELRRYAHLCVMAVYLRYKSAGLPLVTVTLIEGDALGGGFESALAGDVILAEKSAKLGFPEARFGLFPGMGANSFISRRIGEIRTREMLIGGDLYSAEEMLYVGLVDVLAEDGKGVETLHGFLEELDKSFNSRQAIYHASRLANPVTEDELYAITDLWVETALRLSDRDLRKMRNFAIAQERVFRCA